MIDIVMFLLFVITLLVCEIVSGKKEDYKGSLTACLVFTVSAVAIIVITGMGIDIPGPADIIASSFLGHK
ncbi:MAG: hypothetical protein IJC89_00245 [Clostridia bacterium]|nr:hypothetical protein [Clostridia bacterium]